MRKLKFHTCNKGSLSVEMALVFSAIALMIIPLSDLYMQISTNQKITAALRLGVQYAVQNPNNTSDVRQVVLNNVASLDQSNLDVTVDQFCECSGVSALCDASCGSGGMQRFTSINTVYNADYMIGYPGMGNDYNINKTISVRVN